MSGNPWVGVLVIAAMSGGGLFLVLLLGKAKGPRNAVRERFGLPILAALFILGLVGSALILSNGIRTGAAFAFLMAINLFNLADAPRRLWARLLMWLNGAQLAAVTAWAWEDLRTFRIGDPGDQFLTILLVGVVLAAAVVTLYRVFRPKADLPTSTAETGTPA